jgi:hypothetical protein
MRVPRKRGQISFISNIREAFRTWLNAEGTLPPSIQTRVTAIVSGNVIVATGRKREINTQFMI